MGNVNYRSEEHSIYSSDPEVRPRDVNRTSLVLSYHARKMEEARGLRSQKAHPTHRKFHAPRKHAKCPMRDAIAMLQKKRNNAAILMP